MSELVWDGPHRHYLDDATQDGAFGVCDCGEVVVAYHNQSVILSFRPYSPEEFKRNREAGYIPADVEYPR